MGVRTFFIEHGGPWENFYIESLNGKRSYKLPEREVFNTLAQAKAAIEQSPREGNESLSHCALGYGPPTPDAILMPELANEQYRLREPTSYLSLASYCCAGSDNSNVKIA